ncbi:hypothetical protein GQ457_17G004540 [Hibiscus cannabinus]
MLPVNKLSDRSRELNESGLNFGKAPLNLQPARLTSESCLSMIQLGTVPKLRLLKDRSIDKSEGTPLLEIAGKGFENPFLDKFRSCDKLHPTDDQHFQEVEVPQGRKQSALHEKGTVPYWSLQCQCIDSPSWITPNTFPIHEDKLSVLSLKILALKPRRAALSASEQPAANVNGNTSSIEQKTRTFRTHFRICILENGC